ncbi:23S rRNA (uracil(1939)-C(5))-methyltransferase RlmD [Thomasclavelia spiroformis]|uniref:23S rRNA (uracil(1939)-C(5))-methyltransferase RlmD n=1 Tax=Thomasclavelia spiroformis TaxID=29348 RepID=UPI00241FFD63|nr:23S rRNA (uracil(1939)-C(5))-methyltransferase RlmD [Thomasclavelia spiroformis]MBS6685738.1 23S rRNA (uracil(1939)-C(5))-methyltransferase RlmD [Thomasclavelia spiroformis]
MKCLIERKCGSCKYINVEYNQQLEIKTNYCKDLLKNNNLNMYKVEKIKGMQYPYEYRNKIIVAFNQKYEFGFYEENSHRIIPYNRCLLHEEVSDLIIKKIQSLLKRYRVSIYDEKRQRGLLRHVLIRRAIVKDQTMIVLVCNDNVFKGSKNFCNELVKSFPSIKTVVLNVNKRKTSIVLGNEEKVLYGKGFIVDELCGLTFKISPKSFYQINHEQCQALYNKAIDLLELKGNEIVIDAYCGIGTIGMVAAKKAKEVIGVELNQDAIKDANNNARMNKIENIKFVNDDASNFMVELAKTKQRVDCVIMDPPRSGSTKEFMDAIKILNPKKVVYVSCDPTTQVRDIKYFSKLGYQGNVLYPFDMFPHTIHTETVCLLTREKSVKSYAYVDITPSELGMGGKVNKPTYKQIQAYVLETHGLKVSPLYIANVKDEFGLEKQFSYEEAGMSAKKRPNCPSEKRAAIIDALIHFGMLDEDARETE